MFLLTWAASTTAASRLWSWRQKKTIVKWQSIDRRREKLSTLLLLAKISDIEFSLTDGDEKNVQTSQILVDMSVNSCLDGRYTAKMNEGTWFDVAYKAAFSISR